MSKTKRRLVPIPIPLAEDYLAGDDGTIWTTRNRSPRNPRKLRGNLRKDGYRRATLTLRSGNLKYAFIHQLVCLAFHGQPLDGQTMVLHYDGDSKNNTPQNLRWGTPQDNANDSARLGEMTVGSKRRNSKLTEAAVEEIVRSLNNGISTSEISRQFKISPGAIAGIRQRRTWKHVTSTLECKWLPPSEWTPGMKPLHNERHGMSDLTDQDVSEIRRRFLSGESLSSLGRQFGISTAHTHRLVSGQSRMITETQFSMTAHTDGTTVKSIAT